MSELRDLAFVLVALFLCPLLAIAAQENDTNSTTIDAMKSASYSNGFEVRLKISTTKPDRVDVIKVSIIGEFSSARKRLLIRGISPVSIFNHLVVAEQVGKDKYKIRESDRQAVDNKLESDPFIKIFGSNLILWDLFEPWWYWPRQVIADKKSVGSHECTLINSQTDSQKLPVREILSCVDSEGALSLHTEFYDGHHRLLRTVDVEKTMHKESGLKLAKVMSIVSAENVRSTIELYGGDEHFSVNEDTFSLLEIH